MAEFRGKKKRLSINLSFLTLTDHTKPNGANKSVKIFKEPDGVVGLGILAALNDRNLEPIFMNCSRDAVVAISPKSWTNPTPVLSNKNVSDNKNKKLSAGEMELCEEYTCVISHVGDNLIKKREYFDADLLTKNNGSERVSITGGEGGGVGFWVSSGMVSDSSVSPGGETDDFQTENFLNSCFLCKKMLHGLDIFMYRGDKAFCSAECRCKQISIDECKEKLGAGMRNPKEYSISPCSSTMQFFVGVAAA
ncbi:unnamed protein product [Fraxinus pennsylvanica]|uniref:FLZ-type domain-containing protein n=1 Tax=Fraxinus pennsylvanica TaxID=56036 RepID=A0AAD2DQU1_9LAMI|nr:unnamed protein product [Fraxinus pennsylvanica]